MRDQDIIRQEIRFLGRATELTRKRGSVVSMATVKIYLRDYLPVELTDKEKQGDRVAMVCHSDLMAASFPVPPRKDDVLVNTSGKYTVQSVNEVSVGDSIYFYRLEVRGG